MISIIIPTYTNTAGLMACVESVRVHSPAGTYEVIIVANGASESVRVYAADAGVKLLWFDAPIGYTRACNAGAKIATGEYLVFLNDDCVILGPQWLDWMIGPMTTDPQLGLTGPQKEHDPNSHRNFLIFFCVAIRRACWDALGGMDEAFNPGFGEDTDFCIRAEGAGWRWRVVPTDEGHFLVDKPGDTTLPDWKQTKMWVSAFPIYHDGEQTFGKLDSTGPLLDRNRLILRLRHDLTVDIGKALQTDGWMSVQELRWLAIQAADHHCVVEVGSWHGRSSRAIADHLPADGVLWCIDTFNGSSGEPGFHDTAKQREGDDAYLHFCTAMADHLASGRVKVLRMTSANAAEMLAKLGVRPDMIFIDGDHSRPGITADLEHYQPLLVEGGLLCGHDYFVPTAQEMAWMQVKDVVDEHFATVSQAPDTSIWIGGTAQRRRTVFDCFPFFNELDVLELRLAELDPVVDRFVIAEGTLTYQGQPKPLNFDLHKERFAKWLHKITYLVVDDFPATDDPWVRERWQRDAVGRGLFGCWRDDVVIISDADEIPSAAAVAAYQPSQGLVRLKQRLFYAYADLEDPAGWDWCKIAPYHLLRERTACGIRYPEASQVPLIEHGGWHFSFMGGPEAWIQKLEAYAHWEYNVPTLKDGGLLEQRAWAGKDILGRDTKYVRVVDDPYPTYLSENLELFEAAGWFLPEGVLVAGAPEEAVGLVRDAAGSEDRGVAAADGPSGPATGPQPGLVPLGEGRSGVVAVEPLEEVIGIKMPGPAPLTVTCCISTKDRYTTTLPMTLMAIAQQTRPPERLEIYDDGAQKDLRELAPFDQIFRLLDLKGIKWEFFATPRGGQVLNHQHCLDVAQTDLIWRVDDDECPVPDCLAHLLFEMEHDDDVGAVAGLVLVPGQINPAPAWLDGTLATIDQGPNLQWCQWNSGPREVEHLYSTFLYRVEAGRKAGGYPSNLSRIGHREETLFTHQIQRQGYRLLVTPHAMTWHFQQATGGIRSKDSKREMWAHDEEVFAGVLESWGVTRRASRLVVLDCGIGDHLAFQTALPRIRAAHPGTDYVLAVCYPELFPEEKLLSIADAIQLMGRGGVDQANLYKWMWDHDWKRTLPEAWEAMYR